MLLRRARTRSSNARELEHDLGGRFMTRGCIRNLFRNRQESCASRAPEPRWLDNHGSPHLASPSLIDPYVVHFEASRKRRQRRIAALRSADGEVDEYVMRLTERIRAAAILIDGVR
jgi:hypothetical protein